MKKVLVVFGLLFGIVAVGRAGTPQENGQVPFQTGPLSGVTILASSATIVSGSTTTLTISTPTAINSGGGTFQGRNCFTKFVVQISTCNTFTIADNLTTKWTLYGLGLGASGLNTISLPEDHLGPFCTTAGNQTVFSIAPTGQTACGAVQQSINVEGYTTYGGTLNAGPMQ